MKGEAISSNQAPDALVNLGRWYAILAKHGITGSLAEVDPKTIDEILAEMAEEPAKEQEQTNGQ